MHDILIEKSADKRIIEKLKQTPTTIFSNNPFDSTRKLFIREDKDNINDKIYLDFLGNSDDIINEPVIELNNIEKLRIEYSLVDFKKNPQNPFLANNVGLAYLGGKDITKAIEYFNLALNLDPTFRAAKLNLANAYKQTGRFKEAIELYENMLSNNKDDKGVLNKSREPLFNDSSNSTCRKVFELSLE